MAAKASGNKTTVTEITVEAFLAGASPERAREARDLCDLMSRLSGEAGVMWGPSIIGFGTHPYRHDSGRQGVMPAVAFAPRKPAIVLYGLAGSVEGEAGLAALGKVTTGKGCLYFKRLSDANLDALEDLIARSLARRRESAVAQPSLP